MPLREDREAPCVKLLSCSHNALEGILAAPGASAVPRGDAAGEDALSGASVKCVHDGGWAVALIWNRTFTSSAHSVMYTASESSVFLCVLCIPGGLCYRCK